MTRRDWLLAFAAYHGAPDGLDPVRIQKGLFLFAQEARVPAAEKYRFRPYDYGPMSSAIYSDLDALVDEGFLAKHAVPGKRWSRYRATERGFRHARQVLRQAATEGSADAARELYEIKQRVAHLNFNQLLEQVYDNYPDYAVNSIFRQ